LIFFNFQKVLVVIETFGKLVHEMDKGDYFRFFKTFLKLARIAKEDFHCGTETFDLNFSVEAALVASNAIKNSRYVIEFILDFLQKQILFEIVFVLEKLRLVKGQRNGTLSYGFDEEFSHILLSLSIFLRAHA
jgi:hypothetical protein